MLEGQLETILPDSKTYCHFFFAIKLSYSFATLVVPTIEFGYERSLSVNRQY
jgi:hypothetical protein